MQSAKLFKHYSSILNIIAMYHYKKNNGRENIFRLNNKIMLKMVEALHSMLDKALHHSLS